MDKRIFMQLFVGKGVLRFTFIFFESVRLEFLDLLAYKSVPINLC